MAALFFEDFAAGQVRPYGPYTIGEAEIIRFANEFDMQAMHTDPVAAKSGFYGRLIASGWHTAALNMRMFADGILTSSASMGAGGIEDVKWLRPVFPGDALTGTCTALAVRSPASKPDRGSVQFQLELHNQSGERVYYQRHWSIFERRDRAAAADSGGAPVLAAVDPLAGITLVKPEKPLHHYYFDDVPLGATRDIGSYDFTEESILRFGRAYDPQYFHVDPEAAKTSQFGGLIASGWHTASAWMRMMLMHSQRMAQETPGNTQFPRLGPSPGFRNLRWLKPSRPGDVLSFSSTMVGKKQSSLPGWGVLLHYNTGHNQRGEKAFEFSGAVLWERKAK